MPEGVSYTHGCLHAKARTPEHTCSPWQLILLPKLKTIPKKDVRKQQHYKHSDPTPGLSFKVFEEGHPAVEPKPSEAQLNGADHSFQSGRIVHSCIACCLIFG